MNSQSVFFFNTWLRLRGVEDGGGWGRADFPLSPLSAVLPSNPLRGFYPNKKCSMKMFSVRLCSAFFHSRLCCRRRPFKNPEGNSWILIEPLRISFTCFRLNAFKKHSSKFGKCYQSLPHISMCYKNQLQRLDTWIFTFFTIHWCAIHFLSIFALNGNKWGPTHGLQSNLSLNKYGKDLWHVWPSSEAQFLSDTISYEFISLLIHYFII